jgi:hypothetical protein
MNRTFMVLFLSSRINAKKMVMVFQYTRYSHAGGRVNPRGITVTNTSQHTIPEQKNVTEPVLVQTQPTPVTIQVPGITGMQNQTQTTPANTTPATPAPAAVPSCLHLEDRPVQPSGIIGMSVKLGLLKAGAEVGIIVGSTPIGTAGTGSYTWPIASSGTMGSDFKVRVQSISQPAVTDTRLMSSPPL